MSYTKALLQRSCGLYDTVQPQGPPHGHKSRILSVSVKDALSNPSLLTNEEIGYLIYASTHFNFINLRPNLSIFLGNSAPYVIVIFCKARRRQKRYQTRFFDKRVNPCQNMGDYSTKEISSARELSKKIISFSTRQHPSRTFSIDMANGLRRLKEKWETSIQTGHWLLARVHEKAQSGGHCYLLQLPTELLLKITSYLSVIARACLALTCTRLFLTDVAVLNSKFLHFTPDFAPLFKHYRNQYNFATPRWQLIRLLEDRRWLACSRCLKLHMMACFPQRERKKGPEDRICNLGDLAGVVDLCPCIKLTFRGKMDLVDLLRARQQSLTALATQCGISAQERFCWHSCIIKYGPSEVKIRILPELDETDMLKVRVEYELTIQERQLGKEESMIPRLGCAHRAVDMWLASVCNTYDEFGHTLSHISTCSICNTSLICPRKGPLRIDEGSGNSVYDFYTERSLGPRIMSIPDHQWATQRSHPAGDRRTVGDCDEYCPWSPNKYHLLS